VIFQVGIKSSIIKIKENLVYTLSSIERMLFVYILLFKSYTFSVFLQIYAISKLAHFLISLNIVFYFQGP